VQDESELWYVAPLTINKAVMHDGKTLCKEVFADGDDRHAVGLCQSLEYVSGIFCRLAKYVSKGQFKPTRAISGGGGGRKAKPTDHPESMR
jgi:hypothetical protein